MCRSFLSPWKDENGNNKWYGRFNNGVQSVNLPYVGLLAKEQNKNFFEVLDYYLELCHKMGEWRFDRFKKGKITSDVAPLIWQHGGFLRLQEGEEIEPYMENGYATVSLGYTGLADVVKILTGEELISEIGQALGEQIMEHMYDRCEEWKKESGRGWSCYGLPSESSTDYFYKKIVARFGEVPELEGQGYITNSFHINPRTEINIFDKFTIEAKFAKYSLGGNIVYGELPNMSKNLEALLSVIQHIYETNIYAECNCTSDTCWGECKGSTVCELDEDLHWYCTQCGNKDLSKMEIIRRVNTCPNWGVSVKAKSEMIC